MVLPSGELTGFPPSSADPDRPDAARNPISAPSEKSFRFLIIMSSSPNGAGAPQPPRCRQRMGQQRFDRASGWQRRPRAPFARWVEGVARAVDVGSCEWRSVSPPNFRIPLWFGPSVMAANVVRLRRRFKRRALFQTVANKQRPKRAPAHIDPIPPAPDRGSSKGWLMTGECTCGATLADHQAGRADGSR